MADLQVSQIDTDHNFKIWSELFIKTLNKHAQIKSKRVKHDSQPDWLTEDIKNAIKTRDAYHKHKNWSQYKVWRNKTSTLIRKAKKDLFSKSIAENKTNSYLWKHVKNLTEPTRDNILPQSIKTNDSHIDTPSGIINELNKYFTSISNKLKEEYNYEDIPFDFSKLNDYVNEKLPPNVTFVIPYMKLPELQRIIKSLDANKATGLDGMSARLIKSTAHIISPSLLQIINISISTGQFPDALKLAKLIPIHKSGAKDDPANYRPISILSVLSKIIEKHVTKHLFAYLNKYKILHTSQSGFRKNHSCNTALINLIDRWLKNIDKGEINGAVFFDLRKAFDVVDHNLLIRKLAAYKFSEKSLRWIKTYITNRKQCIVDNSLTSSMQTVKSGVPQGSVLGPVLFLLFVNDMPLFITEAYVDIYADDTTVHTSSKDT